MSAYSERQIEGSGFVVELPLEGTGDNPANSPYRRLKLYTASRNHISAAGLASLVARVNTYYTAAKFTSLFRSSTASDRSLTALGFGLSPMGGWFDVLPADIESFVTNLRTDLQASGAVTAAEF